MIKRIQPLTISQGIFIIADMGFMKRYIKNILVKILSTIALLAIIFTFIMVGVFIFKNWNGSAEIGESLNTSLVLLEMYIVIFTIGISILGVIGYTNIKDSTREYVKKSTQDDIKKIISENIDKKFEEYKNQLDEKFSEYEKQFNDYESAYRYLLEELNEARKQLRYAQEIIDDKDNEKK